MGTLQYFKQKNIKKENKFFFKSYPKTNKINKI